MYVLVLSVKEWEQKVMPSYKEVKRYAKTGSG